jgi:acetolactate synthase-1/2/3 large subunit/5-guanidino-2-oxopentanoate decarboxylase
MPLRPLGAQISHMLRERGVDTVFGIPGVHNQELYRGLSEAGIAHVLPRHEQGAAFMADGYARATGRPGVCYLITGPGFLNALTALGQAQSDSVPVLAVASCLRRADLGMGRARLHEMADQAGAGAAACGWSAVAPDATGAFELIDRAFGDFAACRPGSRAVHVPIDLLEGQAPEAPPPPVRPALPLAGAVAVAQAADLLSRARRPLFLFGGGARGGWEAARALLAHVNAASFTTYAGRGIVGPGDPLGFGSFLARPGAAQVLASADLVLAVGTELSEVDIWRPALGHGCPLVRVDIDLGELAEPRADLPVQGDAAAFLAALLAAVAPQPSGWTPAEVATARARWRAEVDAERPGIAPVAEALAEVLPAEATVYSDMTQFAYVAKEIVDMPAPGLWHHPFGFGTLGYALPAAIGGKVGRPGAPVVAIAGDYGLQYTVQELATAVELGLSLPILLWDNDRLGEIEESMARAQIAPTAVRLRNPDFGALAAAYGAGHAAPRTLGALESALAAALEAPGPTLIRMAPGIA